MVRYKGSRRCLMKMIVCGEKICARMQTYERSFGAKIRMRHSFFIPHFAPVAQSVEQEAFNFEVGGSNPPGRTMDVHFKKQCIALRKQDKSITEIMKITGRPKTSIYQHIKDIPLSVARIRQYRIASANRVRKYSLARKGKSVRPFRTFGSWTPETVRLVAHLLFDGEITHGGCVYNNRSLMLIRYVEKLMRLLYSFEPKQWRNRLTGVHRISYHNVALSAYMQKKATILLKEIIRLPVPCKRAFLRAFFNDEGCMDFRPATNHRKVRGYQKDVSILILVQNLLGDFDISARVVKPNEVIIVNKENLIKFEREINFSPGVYMNGNRSNSRWKKHIEKRELLRQAIKSFKN